MFSLFKAKSNSSTREPSKKPVMPNVHVGGISSGARSTDNPNKPTRVEAADAHKKLRKQASAAEQRVNDATMAWLQSLPKDYRPLKTCQAYPHVVNHLCGWWDNVDGLTSYFDDLLNSPRKNRRGFPPPIKTELETLHTFARLRKLVNA